MQETVWLVAELQMTLNNGLTDQCRSEPGFWTTFKALTGSVGLLRGIFRVTDLCIFPDLDFVVFVERFCTLYVTIDLFQTLASVSCTGYI